MAREMKNSGLIWLGQIPSNWQIRRIKDLYQFDTGFTPDTTNQSYYDDENGEDWVCISDMQSKYVCDTKSKISQVYLRANRRSKVKKGSLLFSFKLSVGTVAFAGKDLFTNEAIAAFRENPNINLNFLYYSAPVCIIHNAATNIYGASILNSTRISNAKIVVPPLAEQKVIADFLDAKCGEIDGLLADLDAEVKTLTEYKKSIIAETVTRGLNPNAPMKSSGIPWAESIPTHWGVEKFRYKLKPKKIVGQGDKEVLSVYREYGVVIKSSRDDNHNRTSEDTSNYKYVQPNDFVINKMKAWQGSMGVSNYEGIVSPAYFVYSFRDEDYLPKFFHYYMRNANNIPEYRRLSEGIREGQWDLSPYDLGNMPIILPPMDEQIEIANYLDSKCAAIDQAITDKTQQIETLKAYKSSLIYEYVTGKKQVVL